MNRDATSLTLKIILAALVLFFAPAFAQAACTSPSAGAGSINWSGTAFQACDGTNWVSLGGALSSLSDTTITSPANNDMLRFDGTTSKWKNVAAGAAMNTTTMMPNWPDAITCYAATFSPPLTAIFTLFGVDSSGYRYRFPNTSSLYEIIFASNGSYSTNTGSSAFDCVSSAKSISTLYSEGKAFNFIGGATWSQNAGTGVVYYNGGNVGVGTTSPFGFLHVQGNTSATGVFSNTAPLSSTSGAGMSGFVTSLPSAANQRLGYYTLGYLANGVSAYNPVAIQGFSNQAWTAGSAQGAYLTFSTTPDNSSTRAEVMRLTAVGNVGIGTTAPGTKLQVGAATAGLTASQISATDSTAAYISATGSGVTTYIGGDSNSYGMVGTYSNHPLVFRSNNSERMRLDASGNVGIGATNPQAPMHVKYLSANSTPSNPALILDNPSGGVQTAMSFRVNNSAYANIRADTFGNLVLSSNGGNVYLGYSDLGASATTLTNNGAVGSFSDKRLKRNIRLISGPEALAKIVALEPVSFEWINPSLHGNTASSSGFVAQDIEKIFPHLVERVGCFGKDCELVRGEKAYSISLTPEFSAYLVRAVQQLKADNDNLRKEFEAYKAARP